MLLININADKLNTEERRLKAHVVAGEMHTIFNSPDFEKNLLEELEDIHGELSLWRKDSPKEIFECIMNASEKLTPGTDYEMDLFVDDYYTPKRVIGHTYDSDRFIYTNTKYFDSYPTKRIGSNFGHEWGHKLGFDHDFKATKRRDFSICYAINRAYEKSWDEIFGEPSANDKVLVCKKRFFFFQKCTWVKVKDAEPSPV